MSVNPFMLPPIGATVIARWKCDQRHGGQHMHHIGQIIEIDDWVKISGSNQTPGVLHMTMGMYDSIELVAEQPSDNPFMQAA